MTDTPATTVLTDIHTFEDMIARLDSQVKELVAGDYKECVWVGIHVLMPSSLPEEFLAEWTQKGTWAVNTIASKPKTMPIAVTPSLSSMRVATLQHDVRTVLFDAIIRLDEDRPAVEIIDSLRLKVENEKLTVTVSVLTFIVARKMWHLYPAQNKPLKSTVEHYSFGEAVAELLLTPHFEGMTFKTDLEDATKDVALSRQEVADIFREQQAKTHQDIIRQEAGYYAFLGKFTNCKKTPPFREGLLSLITDMREPNTMAIASWLQQIKKNLGAATTQPFFTQPPLEAAINAASPAASDTPDTLQA